MVVVILLSLSLAIIMVALFYPGTVARVFRHEVGTIQYITYEYREVRGEPKKIPFLHTYVMYSDGSEERI
jgi:hypothetical protein